MLRFYAIGFFFLLLFDTLAQVSFKLAGNASAPAALDVAWIVRLFCEPWVYFAVLGYLGSFVSYMTLLQHAPIGPAFAASHLEVVTVLLFSVIFFKESLNAWQIVGAVLVITGIIVLAMAEEEAEHLESHAA